MFTMSPQLSAAEYYQQTIENQDSIVFLNLAKKSYFKNQFNEAVKYYFLCLNNLESYFDQPCFLDLSKEMLDLSIQLVTKLFAEALTQSKRGNDEAAYIFWKHGMSLGDPASAYNAAMIEFRKGDLTAAKYSLKIILFLANDYLGELHELVGHAHNMLALIRDQQLTSFSSYHDFLKTLTHFRKAEKYGATEATINIHNFWHRIKNTELKRSLLSDSIPIRYHDNNCVKSILEIRSSPEMTHDQVRQWLRYPLPKHKIEAQITTVTQDVPSNKMLRKN